MYQSHVTNIVLNVPEGGAIELFMPATRPLTKKIVIQARAHMVADKEAVGLSRVHMYESKCILPLRDNCIICP